MYDFFNVSLISLNCIIFKKLNPSSLIGHTECIEKYQFMIIISLSIR